MLEQTAVYSMLERVNQLSSAVAWFDAFKFSDIKRMIIEMIQKDQLFERGVDGNNEVIGFYSYATEIASKGKKQQGTHYTLFDTGEFYKSMFIVVLSDALLIKADTNKFDDQVWFSNDIIGLNDESMIKFVSKLRQSYIRYARKVLFENR